MYGPFHPRRVASGLCPCFALVEYFGGKQITNYRYWIFRGGPHDPPMGQALPTPHTSQIPIAYCLTPLSR
jgi:hypothetical protein